MKIAVCVKEVPAGSSRRVIDPATLRLRRDGDCELNMFDANAFEEGLRCWRPSAPGSWWRCRSGRRAQAGR